MRHHRRLRLVTVALVAALAAAGCERTGSGGASSSPAPTEDPASPTAAPAPTVIPVSAFLELPPELRRGDARAHVDVEEALPRLCGDEFAGRGETAASAAVRSAYALRGSPEGSIPSGVLHQTIRTYRGDGATAFMRRLGDDLAACTSYTREGVSFRARTRPVAGIGDEALSIDVSQPQTDLPGNPVGGDQVNRAVVVRVGDTVTILWDAEYERSSSDPTAVDEFARGAVVAIEDWRKP